MFGGSLKEKKKSWNPVTGMALLFIGAHIGITLLGSYFKGDLILVTSTAHAQQDLQEAIYLAIDDFAKFDIRADYTVRAYISKNSYMSVRLRDRTKAIKKIGR